MNGILYPKTVESDSRRGVPLLGPASCSSALKITLKFEGTWAGQKLVGDYRRRGWEVVIMQQPKDPSEGLLMAAELGRSDIIRYCYAVILAWPYPPPYWSTTLSQC